MRWVALGASRGPAATSAPPRSSARRAAAADVVYTTGMFGARAPAARAARAPLRRQADRRPGLRARAPPRASSAGTSTTSRQGAAAPGRGSCDGARRRAPARRARLLPERLPARARRRRGASPPERVSVLPNPSPAAPPPAARGAARPARRQRRDARVRGAPDRPEVARRRARGGRAGGRRRAR